MGLSVAGQPPTVYSLGDGELRTPALMARGTGFASCRPRTQVPPEARGLQRWNVPATGPPPPPFRSARSFCFALARAAGGESFVSVEVAGSNGPRQNTETHLSVTDWIRLSRLEGCTVPEAAYMQFAHPAALLSLAGGWLAGSAAESSRLLSLHGVQEIEKPG